MGQVRRLEAEVIDAWMALRLLKWLGLLLYGAGLWGALVPADGALRAQAARYPATAGFVLLWFAGWGLARLEGTSMGSAWLSASMLLSLIGHQLLIWATERPEQSQAPLRRAAGLLALVLTLLTVGLMVAQPGHRFTHAPAEVSS